MFSFSHHNLYQLKIEKIFATSLIPIIKIDVQLQNPSTYLSHTSNLSIETVSGIYGELFDKFLARRIQYDFKITEIYHKKSIHLNILNNSSISESPGNRGRWFTISANMHPTDQTSTGVE